MLILGIDTSCDDTSAGVVLDGRQVLSSVVSSQFALHSEYGGVVPEIASRRHAEMIIPVMRQSLEEAGLDLRELHGIAVTTGPGLLGSLLVGVAFAKALAFGLRLPLAPVNHLEGHIFANFLGPQIPPFPVLNLVVSGGHSDLILMTGYGAYEFFGRTRDDAAGEAFDKVAREMGLPFPGGPFLDRVAEEGDSGACLFPHPKMEGNPFDFSFSGLKTRATQEFEAHGRSGDFVPHLAASFRHAVVRELLYHVPDLLEATSSRALAISGGVASNSLLRKEAQALCSELGIPLFIPPKDLCTDNGAMVAGAGFYLLREGLAAGPEVNAESALELVPWDAIKKRRMEEL